MLDETTRENLLDWARNYIGQEAKVNNIKVAKGKSYDCNKITKVYHLVELIEQGHEEPDLDNLYRRLQCLIGLHVRPEIVCTLIASDITLTDSESGNNLQFNVTGLSGAFGLVQYRWTYDMDKFELPDFTTAQGQMLLLNIKDKSQTFTTTITLTLTDDNNCEHVVEKEFTFEPYCSIDAEEIIFTDSESGNDLQFTIDGLVGVEPFTYQWSFEDENLELKSGTNNTSASLFLNVINKTEEFTAEISVVITEATGCTKELTKTISFSTYCSLEISGVQASAGQVPVDTDIYIFLDRSSMLTSDVNALKEVLDDWYNGMVENINYTGNKYIIECYSERWLQFASFPRQGILTSFMSETLFPYTVHVNSELPPGLSIVNINGNQGMLQNDSFVPSDKAVVIAFLDQAANSYGRNPIDFSQTGGAITESNNGNLAQPTPQFKRDYFGFESGGTYYGGYTFDEVSNLLYNPLNPATYNKAREAQYFKGFSQLHSEYSFFKMLLYPIVRGTVTQTKSLLLQILASLKAATYSAPETAALTYNPGFTLQEWADMLTLLETQNPYNGVISALSGLGLEVKTDKNSPASAIFTPEVLGVDLEEFFEASFVDRVAFFVNYSGNIGSVSINWTIDTDIFTVDKTENGGIYLEVNTPQENIDTNITVQVTDSGECSSSYSFRYQLNYNEDDSFTQTITPL